MTRLILRFDEIDEAAGPSVGGKGLHLGLMTRAGLPVPAGFCLVQEAHHAVRGTRAARELPAEVRAALVAAYAKLGGGPVAVRSSATCEDGSEASFAGQQETILGVEGEADLFAAVVRCWESLDGERAVAYRKRQDVDESRVAMCVVVQRLVPSEVSGVAFTRDPLDATGRRMLIEAARGLGEAVVSGRVMPDRYHVDRESGEVLQQELGGQRERLGPNGWEPLPEELHGKACLEAAQIAEVAGLARRIEAYYCAPRDIEWAWAEGRCHILQARPITAADAAEIEQVRQEEIARLKERAEPGGTVWAKYNLAEVLPTPTPVTWEIMERFMSGYGGFGRMYRDLGYDPDWHLNTCSLIDLICGRPYVNLSREPWLYFADFPYGYDFAAIRRDPAKGLYPQLITDPARKTARFWWRLPVIVFHMARSQVRIRRALKEHAAKLRNVVFPEFVAETAADADPAVWAQRSETELLDRAEHWIRRTLDDFAPQSLQASLLAATAIGQLGALLARAGLPDGQSAAQNLMMGVRPDPDCDFAAALEALAAGRIDRATFLAQFGHRGPGEMELAHPRWSENPDLLPVPHVASGDAQTKGAAHGANTAHRAGDALRTLDEVLAGRTVDAGLRRALEATLKTARDFLALREAGKHHFLRGYALIRRAFVELGERLGLGDDVFQLDGLDLCIVRAYVGKETWRELFGERIATRKRRGRIARGLTVPPVLFSDDLEAIGRPIVPAGAEELVGTPVSFGTYEGRALVLTEPIPADDVEPGFVLVCPSTDPAWVPLFLKAGALVMETGGILSHGAIVAREFGLPAVAGIANAPQRFRTGQRLHVDGTTGRVHAFAE